MFCRLGGGGGEPDSSVSGQQWSAYCHFDASRSPLRSDPSNGEVGSARRDVEAARLRRLGPSTGARYSGTLGHRRTQDFTMEGVHMVEAGSGSLRDEVPQKLKKKCEISVQFLTFSCIQFWI